MSGVLFVGEGLAAFPLGDGLRAAPPAAKPLMTRLAGAL
jgi:hypothetical protein